MRERERESKRGRQRVKRTVVGECMGGTKKECHDHYNMKQRLSTLSEDTAIQAFKFLVPI